MADSCLEDEHFASSLSRPLLFVHASSMSRENVVTQYAAKAHS